MFPTHGIIDGETHSIGSIELVENSAHTHRVRFACGIIFDVRGEHQFTEHAVKSEHPAADDQSILALKTALALSMVAEQAHASLQSFVSRETAIVKRDRSWWRRMLGRLRGHPSTALIAEQRQGAQQRHDVAYLEYARACEAYHAARPASVHERWITATAAEPVSSGCATCRDVELGKRQAVAPAPRDTSKIRYPDIATGLACPECGGEIRMRRYGEGAACNGGHDFEMPDVLRVAANLIERLAKGEVVPAVVASTTPAATTDPEHEAPPEKDR